MLLQVFLPVILIVGAGFLLARAYVIHRLSQQQQTEQIKITLPLRLGAYERLTLLIERIRPTTALLEVALKDLTTPDLQTTLLDQIRSEFKHNVTLQVYVSAELWNQIQAVKEEIILLINQSAQEIASGAPAVELAREILQQQANNTHDNADLVLQSIKDEAQKYVLI